jgi:hypothetical protein
MKPICAIDSAFGPLRQQPTEKLITLKEAADTLGLPSWKLRRAAKGGLFPIYTLLNTRLLVKLSEVVAAIEATRQGGAE